MSVPSDGIYGSGAHSDYGMLTLLATDQQPGLQLYLKSNQWFDVKPIPVYRTSSMLHMYHALNHNRHPDV